MQRRTALMIVTLTLSVLLAACNFGVGETTPPAGNVRTAAAQTLAAMATREAKIPTLPTGQATLPPQVTPTPPYTPTTPPAVTTPKPTLKTPGVACDAAVYVRDINIPDGLSIPPGSTFTKTWELKNAGTCTWTTAYSLVFANQGSSMGGPASKPLITSGSVAPGQTVKVSVDLVAPSSPGKYKGYWMLRNPDGVLFGTGNNASVAFYVEMTTANEYEFSQALCSAEWRTADGVLECSKGNEDTGFATSTNAPKLENGATDDEATLIVMPKKVTNGTISGRYPAVIVPPNSSLRGVVGCYFEAKKCSAQIKISYQVTGENEQTLLDIIETYDGKFTSVDFDLAALGLTGKSVAFRFTIGANGPADQDKVFLLRPRIVPTQ